MAKKIYIGVNNVTREVKKAYVGVNNVARKIKAGYVGVNNVARPFISTIEVGHYWLIDANGTKEYSSNGTLLSSNTNKTTWTCLESGTYSIELHGKGGDGGTGIANFHMVHNITYDYGTNRMAGAGGGGGGSGVIYSSISLIKNDDFTITWNGGATTLSGASKTYSCNPGTNGGNGTASDPWSSYVSAHGGAGGAIATYTSGGTNLASAGSGGDAEWYWGNSRAAGGAGGSGGATVGSYGDGGNGANVPGHDWNGTESETYIGAQG